MLIEDTLINTTKKNIEIILYLFGKSFYLNIPLFEVIFELNLIGSLEIRGHVNNRVTRQLRQTHF